MAIECIRSVRFVEAVIRSFRFVEAVIRSVNFLETTLDNLFIVQLKREEKYGKQI